MSEIAVIGDRDTVWPFKAFGIDVFFADERQSPQALLSEVVRKQYKIVFVTEDCYDEARQMIDEFTETAVPAFTVIPSVKGSRGIALQSIRDSVRRAMGAEFI